VSPIRQILRLWRPDAAYLALGAVLTLAALAAALLLTGASARAIGVALAGGALAVPLILQAAGAARVVLRYAERTSTHDAMFRALAAVRIWFFAGLARSAAGGLGLRHAGDALSRLVSDVFLLLPILAFLLLRESAWALFALAPFAFTAIYLPLRAAGAARQTAGRANLAMAGLRTTALDALTGLREVKIFAAEGRMLAAIQSREASLLAAQRETTATASRLNALAFLAAQAGILLAIMIGFTSHTPLATLVAVLVLAAAFEVVSGLPRAGASYGQAQAAAARVVAAATAAPPVPDPATPAAMPSSNAITFEHVGFRYAADLPAVFESLSLQLPPGSRTAILGPSGAGKSTIAALLLKLIEPVSGRIRLGPADLTALPAEAVRTRIAYLSQTTHLFADTIRNNLRLGDPAATDAMLWAALDTAQLAETIRALPEGLSSWLGEGGCTLSGGQSRRLALARTIISPAPILLLDEPCAGLDAATETEFFKTLNTAAAGRTLILIVHRLTGAEQLDRIWRLTGGTLVSATS
jgi:ATP-binding cassette subfamily C protein CydC